MEVDLSVFPCDSVLVSNHSAMHSEWATRIGMSLRCFDGTDSALFSIAYDGYYVCCIWCDCQFFGTCCAMLKSCQVECVAGALYEGVFIASYIDLFVFGVVLFSICDLW